MDSEDDFEDGSEGSSSQARRNELDSHDAVLFNNPQYSDIQIYHGSRTWPAHRSIICPRSEFFRKLCAGAVGNGVFLKKGDSHAVHAMLEFLYTGNYDDTACTFMDDYEVVRFNMLVFIVAEIYQMPDLSRFSLAGFQIYTASDWRFPQFAAVAEELNTAPINPKHQPLRDAVLEVCANNAKEIFAKDNEMASGHIGPEPPRDPVELRGVLKDVPGLAFDVTAKYLKL